MVYPFTHVYPLRSWWKGPPSDQLHQPQIQPRFEVRSKRARSDALELKVLQQALAHGERHKAPVVASCAKAAAVGWPVGRLAWSVLRWRFGLGTDSKATVLDCFPLAWRGQHGQPREATWGHLGACSGLASLARTLLLLVTRRPLRALIVLYCEQVHDVPIWHRPWLRYVEFKICSTSRFQSEANMYRAMVRVCVFLY